MQTIDEVLRAKKNNGIWSVTPETSTYDSLKKMADLNIGALLIIENDQLVGIFTERDYARKIILCGKCSMDTPVKEIMTPDPVTVSPEQTVDDAMWLMIDHHIRHLPVVKDGKLVGMISVRNLVEAIIQRQEKQIDHLEKYISSSDYAH